MPALLATAVAILGYYALDLPPVGVAAPAAAVLYRASERGRVVPAAVVAGSLLAVSVVARLAEGDDIGVVVGTQLGSEAALLLAVIALGDAVRNRRSLRAALIRQAVAADEERHREAARQVEAERLRIAREVHDTLGHTMSVITLQSAVAREALADSDPAQAESALAAIRSVSGSAMAELRATLGTLRREPGPREPAPGFDRLPALVDGVRQGGLAVDLRVEGPVDRLPAVVGSTVYRVVQEALTNVLRHAGATRVTVTVRATAARLALEVVDDGRGGPPAGAGGRRGSGPARHGRAGRPPGRHRRNRHGRNRRTGGTAATPAAPVSAWRSACRWRGWPREPDPRRPRRRPAPGPDRPARAARPGAGHRGGGRGGRRPQRPRRGTRAATRHRADGRPDARRGRAGGDPADPDRPDAGRRAGA